MALFPRVTAAASTSVFAFVPTTCPTPLAFAPAAAVTAAVTAAATAAVTVTAHLSFLALPPMMTPILGMPLALALVFLPMLVVGVITGVSHGRT